MDVDPLFDYVTVETEQIIIYMHGLFEHVYMYIQSMMSSEEKMGSRYIHARWTLTHSSITSL